MKERRFWFHRNKNFPLSVVIQMKKRLLTSAPNDRLQTRAQANVILVTWKFCFKGGKLCVQKLHAGFKSWTSLKFFRPYFHYCLSSVHCCEDIYYLLYILYIYIYIYSQLFIYHFTSLIRITIMTSSQLTCWLRWCSTELVSQRSWV